MAKMESTSLSQRLLNYFQIERGEERLTLLLGSYLLLAMATVISIKAVANSAFLSEYDAKMLPWADLAVTVVVGGVVSYYLRLSNRLALGRLVFLSQVGLAACLLVFWALLMGSVTGVPLLLYVSVGVLSALIPSQVWSVVGASVTTRQAKRLFALIGSGGILGAALGGTLTGWIGSRFGSEGLLPVAALMMALAAAIGGAVSRRPGAITQGAATEKASILESFREVRGSRYLSLITLVIFCAAVVSTLVKYQFNASAQEYFASDRDALSSFFGYFNGYIAVFSFAFHALLTSRLLRWFGLAGCLLILPLSLFGGTTFLLLMTSFTAALVARGSDQSFRHSIDRACQELLYVPLSGKVRNRVKSFLDLVVARTADGAASVVLLVLVTGLGAGVAQISWASLVVLAFWLGGLVMLRGEYVSVLRRTIERKDIQAEETLRRLANAEPEQTISDALAATDTRTVEAAVAWISFGGAGVEQAQLTRLLTHESKAIRRKALEVVAAQDVKGNEDAVIQFIEEEDDLQARRIGLGYLDSQSKKRTAKVCKRWMDGADVELAALAAGWLLSNDGGSPEAEQVYWQCVDSARAGDVENRLRAARLLSLGPPGDRARVALSALLRDEDSRVLSAAIESCGVLKPVDEIGRLLKLLQTPSHRKVAREALAAYGEPLLDKLRLHAADSAASGVDNREIPRVVAAVGGPAAAEFLVESMRRKHHLERDGWLSALVRLYQKEPSLRLDSSRIKNLLIDEIRGYYEGIELLETLSAGPRDKGASFLKRALDERQASRLRKIFLFLSLIYPTREMRDAGHWVLKGSAQLRANAIEFLDTRVASDIRQLLLPMIESGDQTTKVFAGRQLFRFESMPYASGLRRLMATPDPWLQACAAHAAGDSGAQSLLPRLRELSAHFNPVLREAAGSAAIRLAASG